MELNTPSGFSERSLRFGDHLCYIYENDEEKFYTSIPFIKAGLDNSEKCIYVGDKDSCNKLEDLLERLDVDTEATKKIGQLCVATDQNLFQRGGNFNLEKMLGLLRKTIEKISEEGWKGVRVVQEMGWTDKHAKKNYNSLEYEGDLSYGISKESAIFLCQYDSRKFKRETLVQVLKLHNTVIVGDIIYENQLRVDINDVLPTR